MHVHHAYIGLALMLISALSMWFRFSFLVEYKFCVALAFFVLGLVVFLHDLVWHLTHRRKV
ncbi:MAG: hypothetical protein QXG10_01840 [Candidatus Hadarchaeales archaeon]